MPDTVLNYPPEKRAVDIWAVNGKVVELDVRVKLAAFDIETGGAVTLSKTKMNVRLPSNRSTEIARIDIPEADTTVVVAYLEDAGTSELLARWVSWPEPLKFVRFRPDLEVATRVVEDKVLVSANSPAKGVMLSVPVEEGEDAAWEDNFVDLVPGEEVSIGVKGLDGRTITTRWLCDWE